MTSLADMKAAIEESAERWKASAEAMRRTMQASLEDISDSLEAEKQKANTHIEQMKAAVRRGGDAASDARRKAIADLEALQLQLALGRAEAGDAIREQSAKIARAAAQAEKSLEDLGADIDRDVSAAAAAWLRAQQQMEEQFELAALRFDAGVKTTRAEVQKTQKEVMSQLDAFERDLERRTAAASGKASTFATDMKAALEQIKTAFSKL